MSGDQWVDVVWFVGAFSLVISAVAAHRIPLGTMAKMAMVWILIFGAVALLVWGWQLTR